MSFGKNLKHLRRMCGEITQEALAEKLKVSRQTVSKWGLDESTPEMDKHAGAEPEPPHDNAFGRFSPLSS